MSSGSAVPPTRVTRGLGRGEWPRESPSNIAVSHTRSSLGWCSVRRSLFTTRYRRAPRGPSRSRRFPRSSTDRPATPCPGPACAAPPRRRRSRVPRRRRGRRARELVAGSYANRGRGARRPQDAAGLSPSVERRRTMGLRPLRTRQGVRILGSSVIPRSSPRRRRVDSGHPCIGKGSRWCFNWPCEVAESRGAFGPLVLQSGLENGDTLLIILVSFLSRRL